QAVTPDGSDQPLHVGPLPWASRRREDLLHAHAADSLVELTPIDLVPISQQVTWCSVFGKGLDHLLSGPPRRRMLRHVKVNHTPAVMSQRYQDKQDPKGGSRNRKEIDRDQILDMVVQESPPGLGRGFPVLRHEAGTRALGN